MADSDFLDDSNELFGALGSQSVKKIAKMQAKTQKRCCSNKTNITKV